MKKDSYVQGILIADEGKVLYNAKEDIYSIKVYLGRDADENDWVETIEPEENEIENEGN